MLRKKLRLYYWLFLAFVEKYLLYVALSFFVTSIVIAFYIFFSRDILQVLVLERHRIGISGYYTLDDPPDDVLEKVTAPLFIRKQDGSYESEVVRSYSHDPDFKRFEISLYPDQYFTDGTKFTSSDITLAFRDVKISRPDNLHMVFELQKSFPPFLTYLERPIYTTNPFKGIKGRYMITRANYTRSGERLESLLLSPLVPNIPKLEYRFYRTEGDLVTAYKLREIDEFTTQGRVASEAFEDWKDTMVTRSSDFDRVVALFFDLDHPLLKEKDMRLALYGSIPVKLLETLGNIAVSPVSPLSPYYDPSIPRIAENPEVNKNILRRFFSESSESAHLKLSTSIEFINLAHVIEEIVESAGGTCTVNIVGLRPGERSDMTLGLWDIPREVNQYFVWHSSQKDRSNITHFDNKKVDKLLEDYRATDSAKMHKELMVSFQNTLVDEAPAVFLYYPYTYTIERKK